MKNRYILISWVIPMFVGLSNAMAAAEGDETIRANLTGFEQVPVAITTGKGQFVGTLNEAAGSISYNLNYSDLEGTPILFADIHVGQRLANGGIAVFLCSTTPPANTTPAPGTPACPTTATGTITGTIMANNIIGPAGQGIKAGDFAKLVQAIRTGNTYVQFHTEGFSTGEIRGQVVSKHQRMSSEQQP